MKSTIRTRRFGAPFVAVTAATTALLVLSGCTSTDADAGGPTEITFSYLWGGAEGEGVEKIIADFNASQDDIVVKGVSSPDSQAQLTAMSASQGSFDISDNFGNGVGSWASKGIIAPLDDYMETYGIDADDFVPAAMEQMTYDGKIYSMPIAIHDYQLVYNKDLLDAAGVEVPTTTDELADAIEKLTVQEADGTITQLGFGDPSISTTLTTLGYAFGGEWNDADGPTPTDPGNIAAAEWYQDSITNKFGAANIADFVSGVGQYMSPEDPFYTGKYAMVIDGSWQANGIAVNAPELDWGVTSIPVPSSELEGSTQLTASTLFIPANSKHKEEAAEFMAYLVSEDGMLAFAKALGNLPSRTSLLDSDEFSSIVGLDTWLAALKSPNVKALSSAPYSAEYTTDLGAAFDDITRDANTPEDALAAVADKIDGYAKN